MKGIVYFLICVALSTLVIAILNLFCLIPENLIEESKMLTLPAIAISSGVMIASITYLRDKDSQVTERKKQNDEVMLNLSKEGFEEVYNLLKDLNNNRTTWIRAARLLCDSLSLKEEIKLPQYKKAYDLAEEKLRNQLYRLLQINSENSNESDKLSLPAQFFYGVKNWKDTSLTVDDAAINSTSPTKSYEVNINNIIPNPKLSSLSESSVVAIYDFLNYSKEYKDPLEKVKLWEGHYSGAYGIEQGARRYIYHKEKYSIIDGKLFERK